MLIHACFRAQVTYTGIPVLGVCSLLSALTALTCLRLAHNRLTAVDAAHVGTLTGLEDLSLCWVPGSTARSAAVYLSPQVRVGGVQACSVAGRLGA